MTETEFLEEAEAEMNRLQDHIESKYEDVDCTRSGNVLTIELEDGAQAVVNIQTPMQEIWFASHLGGMHFRETNKGWINPRDGRTLEETVEGAIDALMSR
ncbi:iron donor protein CyaY [Sutterella faecalis]|uniref:Iron donor protein CyaY n=2 Tax=Sutterella TaxID=40544 RepID=A0AAI9SCC8_9BURK|nr:MULTISPECIES: iron donor protein CyaY [Sutterella]KAB7650596.1 iron donor protein CyaY [Sutterella seckii]MBE5691817.1 iron donor protein CyaY [Sutterella sp.]QDA54996.1 iron donor protein CyaY [Sutterella faecalis]